MKRKRRLKIVALVVCALIMLATVSACQQVAPAGQTDQSAGNAGAPTTSGAAQSTGGKDHITVVVSSDPANMDPNESDEQTHYQVTRQIYETLFVYDDNYEIQPWLCESYSYEDDCTIIMKLRQGVKFHNGDELKASDVLFTFKRIVENKLGGGYVDIANVDISKCEVLDDYTFKLVTKGPVSTQIALLEGPSSGILCERAYTEANGDFLNGACCGTGPYKFVSYEPGDKIELTANEDYWIEGQPYIKSITMRVIVDSSSRSIEAETHGSDIVYDINATDLEMVDSTDGVRIISDLGTNTSHLLMNTAKEPLNNPLVREAIFYAVDAKAAVKLAYRDYGSFTQGWVCPGILGYDKSITDKYMVQRDVEKAKSLLAEAGYPNGIDLEIACSTGNQQRLDMAEAFQAQVAEAGINLTLNVMEGSAQSAYILGGEHQLVIYGFSAADFESDRALVQFMPTHVNYNLCAYDNPEFQALVQESFVTLDSAKRADLYKQAAEMLMKDHITLPLWHKALNAAVSDDLEGFKITRSYEHHYLQNVKFK